MSAFPDDPGHFLRWMGFSTSEQANRFAPRLTYGAICASNCWRRCLPRPIG
jgi:uncharacterized NAD(P)/FAD-binding protein YdhS